jgi:hypothetical protein
MDNKIDKYWLLHLQRATQISFLPFSRLLPIHRTPFFKIDQAQQDECFITYG